MIRQLTHHEGLRLKLYQCPAGKLTIGIGRNLEDKGITEQEAVMLLENDIQECVDDLKPLFDDFGTLPEPVRQVLVDMRFNLGPRRFRQSKKMIAAVNARNFTQAAEPQPMQDRGIKNILNFIDLVLKYGTIFP